MFDPGSTLLALFPDKAHERRYRRGTVVRLEEDTLIAKFDERFEPVVDVEVYLCQKDNGKFVRTPATLQAFLLTTPLTLRFMLVGEPEVSDNRRSFRISVADRNLLAQVKDITTCQLMDVSAEGLCILSPVPFTFDETVEVTVNHQSKHYNGRARVRSVQSGLDGMFRLGLEALEGEQKLRKGLLLINISAQHQQLRRLSERKG